MLDDSFNGPSQQETGEPAILSEQQRRKMAKAIDRLDIEDVIRQKAQNYFTREQSRLDFEAKSLNQSQEMCSTQRSGARSFRDNHLQTQLQRNEKKRPNIQIKKLNMILANNNQGLQKADGGSSEQELLESTYSQREIAPQTEIKRQLHQIIASKERGRDEEWWNSQQSQKQTYAKLGRVNQQHWLDQDNQGLNQTQMQWPRESLRAQASIAEDHQIVRKSVCETPDRSQFNITPSAGRSSNMSFQRQDRNVRNVIFEDRQNEMRRTFKKSPLKQINSDQALPRLEHVKSREEFDLEQEHERLLEISREFRQKKKAQMAQTMYNTRTSKQNLKMEKSERDYCIKILGKYRFGLNQKAPISTDPNAPAAHRFSQLACYRFAEGNQKYMDLYDEQIQELRKTRRFLADQINKSAEGRNHVRQMLSEQPLMQNMAQSLQLKLIDETIQDQIKVVKEKQEKLSGGLLDLQEHKRRTRSREGQNHKFNCASSSESNNNQHIATPPDSAMSQLSLVRAREFEDILRTDAVNFIDEPTQERLEECMQKLLKGEPILDIHSDFVSRAGKDFQIKMKKATYEMDQLITDHYYGDEQQKMGLSLCYNQQNVDQRRFLKQQQKQLLTYLNILFGGETDSQSFQDMSKNLIKKLSRQKTDDSMAREGAREIEDAQTANLNIDEDNVNTEIVTLLAEEILRKTEFFKMYKSTVRGVNDMIQESPFKEEQELDVEQVKNSKTKLQSKIQGINNPKLDSFVIDEKLNTGKSFLNKMANSIKDGTNPEMGLASPQDVYIEQAKASFIQQCEKNLVVALPLLLRIKDKRIYLQRYQLNHGLCQALSIAFSNFPDIATDFHFESNNFTDDDFAVLLDGINELTIVSSLTYNHNQFGKKSLDALMPIIRREQTQLALRSLHLVHCKITAKVTNELLMSLNQQKNRIRALSLVNVNLNGLNYQALCQLIKVSRSLQELDISWNGMRCSQVYELIDFITENRSLQFLNLSYNNLHSPLEAKFAQSTPYEMEKTEKARKTLEIKSKNAKTTAQKAAVEYEQMDNSMKHILKLCKFIKLNSKLMHLNLSGMGMTQPMMNAFGRALRRTKSMVSLHLSQNNGDSESLRVALVERAHIKPFEPIVRPDLRSIEIRENQLGDHKQEFRLENSIIIGNEAERNMRPEAKAKISEQLNLKNMLKHKRGQCDRQAVEKDASEMLIFTRYLGHKVEMPGSGQWRMIATSNDEQERCWVCNQEVYSLVFWSREFGFKTQQELEKYGMDELACENVISELEDRNEERGISIDYHEDKGNPQLYEKAHKLTGFPLIQGEFNNWKPQRMYTIEELCYILDSQKPDIIANLKKANYMSPNVQTPADMNPKERAEYDYRILGIMERYNRMKNWRKLLGSTLKYKAPFLANAEALLMQKPDANISKMDEELYPSDSVSSQASADSSDDSEELEGTASQLGLSESDTKINQPRKTFAQAAQSSQGMLRPSNFTNMSLTSKTVGVKTRNRMARQLYVLPCFLKPGKQTCIVQSLCWNQQNDFGPPSRHKSSTSMKIDQQQSISGDQLTLQYFFHNIAAPMRRERVPLFVKQLRRKVGEEDTFDRGATVFKDWKEPTDKDFEKMIDHDIKHWKIQKFIKDDKRLEDVFKLFYKHIKKLFYIMVTTASDSNFPNINWLDFTRFSETCKVPDKHVLQSDIDRFFMASVGKAQVGNYRYQFLEALMRCAERKFYQSGEAKTQAEALSRFIEQNILPNGPLADWQEFRETVWWTWENHKILSVNQASLQKIYKSYFRPRKKYLDKTDCIDLMTRYSKIIPDENKVIYCFGMSKMAVISDTTERNKLEELKFVEFQEFLGRCAFIKYKEVTDMTMDERLIAVLDEILPLYGLVRKEAEDEEEEFSESDPDY